MEIRETRLQNGKLIYKVGILLTKVAFRLQKGIFALQTGLSGYNSPLGPFHGFIAHYFVNFICLLVQNQVY